MGGWSGSTRRDRLPADWSAIRAKRLEIDGYRCTRIYPGGLRCPNRATDVDHMQAMTDDHSLEALRSMCSPCHREKSGIEGGRAAGALRRKIAAAKFRPAEGHPGLVPKEKS